MLGAGAGCIQLQSQQAAPANRTTNSARFHRLRPCHPAARIGDPRANVTLASRDPVRGPQRRGSRKDPSALADELRQVTTIAGGCDLEPILSRVNLQLTQRYAGRRIEVSATKRADDRVGTQRVRPHPDPPSTRTRHVGILRVLRLVTMAV